MVAFDIYRQQVHDFIRLQAWYVWHLHMQRCLPYESIFGNQLVRFGYEPPGGAEQPAWQALQHDLLDQCQSYGLAPQTAALEENILRQVQSFVNDDYLQAGPYARYQENVRQASPYAGFTHDVGGEKLSLHFTNTMDPDSPLRHPAQLRAGLGRLLTEARECCPELSEVYCGSWLNSVPRFAELFPASWLAGAEAPPPAGHGGWWGQFTDRTGALHEENARYLRQTGNFRFPCLRCTCLLDDLQRHLG
jgi:hypothetical protein